MNVNFKVNIANISQYSKETLLSSKEIDFKQNNDTTRIYENKKEEYKNHARAHLSHSNYFIINNDTKIHGYAKSVSLAYLGNYFFDEKEIYANLNSYAKENTINTNFGKAEVFLDLYDDNDKLGIGKIVSNKQLFNFDSNRNGKVEAGDKYFDKLKIRAYDKDGNEIIKKLSEVVSHINLRDFIKDKKAIQENILERKSNFDQNIKDFRFLNEVNPYSYFKEEYRYNKMEKKKFIHCLTIMPIKMAGLI